jgi:O-antigen ligase
MRKFSAVFLFLTVIATVAVMWIKAKWATTIPEVAALSLLALWALLFLTGRARPRLTRILIPFSGILVWGGLQILLGTTVYQWPTRMALLYWAGNLAVFICGLQIFQDQRLRSAFLRALVFFGFGVSILSTLQALTSENLIYWYFPSPVSLGGIFGPFLYRNQYAAFVELLLPVALFLAITSRKRKLLYYLIVATLYVSVVASGSRAGFVLTTLELAVTPLLVARRQAFSRAQIINGALVLVGMLLWLSVPAGPDLLISKFGNADPFAGRREFDQSSLQMIRARPLIGFGLGNWPTAYPGYALFDDGLFANQAHNDWAQWTVEGGIPFLCLLLWIGGWGGIRGVRTAWGLGVPAVLLHCFVDYPIQRPGVAIVFFLMLAAVAGSGDSEMKREET